jgi:hypothetical protein
VKNVGQSPVASAHMKRTGIAKTITTAKTKAPIPGIAQSNAPGTPFASALARLNVAEMTMQLAITPYVNKEQTAMMIARRMEWVPIASKTGQGCSFALSDWDSWTCFS